MKSRANFCKIKCIEDSEVTLHCHLAHPFIIARITLYLRELIQKALAKFLSSQYLKEYSQLLPKSRKIPIYENLKMQGKKILLVILCCLLECPCPDKLA